MKIGIQKIVEVEAKEIRLYCKIVDYFTAHIYDQDGKEIGGQDDGYVPGFMPGDHYGDYIILNIDLETGNILNWNPPSAKQIMEFINPKEEE